MRTLGRFLGSMALLLALGSPAVAEPRARCAVRSISASRGAGGIDPQLADLQAQLTRPPFTEWKSFRLLAMHQVELMPGSTSSFALPEERQGQLIYKQHVLGEGGRHRVRLQLEVRKGSEVQLSTVFVLDEGGTVLTAGNKYGDGILILGVTCKTDS